jgi:2-C-methyl-D-erythritol 2,4-cyclodiphosphate synthase/2-C-methyl-D-erythritol 4-phosphate cytidylyltransferase
MDLNGEPIYIWSVKAFQKTPCITGIIVVGPGHDNQALRDIQVRTAPFPKVLTVVAGGSCRTESVNNGVTALQANCKITEPDAVLVHDGVRPLVTPDLITKVADKVSLNCAAIPTTTPTATVKKITGETISHTINRVETGLAQTPQGVSYKWLREALSHWHNQPAANITDEGSLLENLPQNHRRQIKMINVAGDPDNLKITFPQDHQKARMLLDERRNLNKGDCPPIYKPRTATGFGYDVHAFATGRKLILGGVDIPYHLGLDGHSDADVLTHALIDAILGAIGAGDIGHHFPDHDPAHKNRCSLDFLGHTMQLVKRQGFYLEAADITVVAEQPKLKPHIPEMLIKLKEKIVLPCQLNIKATTTEGLGFAGRREGIAAYAVATVTAT